MAKEDLDFKISTGLKDIIGRELITQAHTAIFELVKNAYDANATRVDIVFQDITSNRPNRGKIQIVDDGDGMSYHDIKNKWLFVGYSKKKEQDASRNDFRDKVANKNRWMAGSKGIGRFSADRLGEKLDLYTKTHSDSFVHRVRMDWGKFENNQDEEFQTVKVEYDTLDEFPSTVTQNLVHGTVLEIYPLTHIAWDKDQLRKLKKYLQRLVNPVQVSGGEKFEIHMAASEFLELDKKAGKDKEHQKINGKVRNFVFEELGIKTTQITCTIKDSRVTTQIIDKGRFVFKMEEINESWKYLRDISVNVFYLNPEAKKIFTRRMGMRPIKFGSIFLYRNGFRVHPYGEEQDDWLGLEQRKGQGYSRYLSTRELLGRIEINRSQGGFSEVSSRHGGVVETEEYRQLLQFMGTRVIRWLERYVVEGLDWDRPEEKARKSPESLKESSLNVLGRFTNQVKDPNKRVIFNEDLMDILEEKRVGDVPEIVKNLRTLASHVESKTERTRINKAITLLVDMMKPQLGTMADTRVLKAKEKEILFLKKSKLQDSKLAADYNHWIVISTDYIKGYLHDLIDAIREGKLDDMMPLIESIGRENQRIRTVASIVSKANFDVQSPKVTANLVSYIVQYVEQVLTSPSKKIRVTFYNKNISFETKFTPLEISMMLDNFVNNSRKAYAKRVIIRFLVVEETLRMFVADDGKGMSNENRERVFERGFTTTDGSGIGLSHIRTVVEKMGGKVMFLGNDIEGLANGACFVVIFNAVR